MATRLLTDKQWRAKHGWGELQAENKQQADFLSLAKEEMDILQAENKRLKERIKELTQGSDKKVDSFPL